MNFSIRELEALSGIKAHTIRIWEQRYEILKPKRTGTNIRYYDEEDLRLLLNVAYLNQHGYKISQIVEMSPERLSELVRNLGEKENSFNPQINALILATVELDELQVEKLISSCTLRYGFIQTMLKIISPLFERIGILWQSGSIRPAQEHFISNIIRQKIIVAIDAQGTSTDPEAKKFLLFLPSNELHEIGLLLAAYIIKSYHHKVIYLGQAVPFADLKLVYECYHPDVVVTCLTHVAPAGKQIRDFIDGLAEAFPKAQIIAGGLQVRCSDLCAQERVHFLRNLPEFIDFLESLKRSDSRN
ncbi:MAG: MerR family transcriptional regulator [Bacteroidia bacterium]